MELAELSSVVPFVPKIKNLLKKLEVDNGLSALGLSQKLTVKFETAPKLIVLLPVVYATGEMALLYAPPVKFKHLPCPPGPEPAAPCKSVATLLVTMFSTTPATESAVVVPVSPKVNCIFRVCAES